LEEEAGALAGDLEESSALAGDLGALALSTRVAATIFASELKKKNQVRLILLNN
jgi:hypothetical protein